MELSAYSDENSLNSYIRNRICRYVTMAELTIQIPDELLERLEPLRNRLPELY
jgi:hypothetical protein